MCSLSQRRSAEASFLPTPRPGINPTPFQPDLTGDSVLRTEKGKPRIRQDTLCVPPPHPASLLSIQLCLPFTRFVFFSSALLADMMEEARVFSSSQPPHDGNPVTRPLSYADYRPRQGQDDHLSVCRTAEVTMPRGHMLAWSVTAAPSLGGFGYCDEEFRSESKATGSPFHMGEVSCKVLPEGPCLSWLKHKAHLRRSKDCWLLPQKALPPDEERVSARNS